MSICFLTIRRSSQCIVVVYTLLFCSKLNAWCEIFYLKIKTSIVLHKFFWWINKFGVKRCLVILNKILLIFVDVGEKRAVALYPDHIHGRTPLALKYIQFKDFSYVRQLVDNLFTTLLMVMETTLKSWNVSIFYVYNDSLSLQIKKLNKAKQK